MSQEDYVIADQRMLPGREDINNNFAAIASQNSGTTSPATTFPYMLWADTTSGILKQRNAADTAWVSILTMASGEFVQTNNEDIILETPTDLDGFTQKIYTGIPSGTKKIIVELENVEASRDDSFLIQLGDSGGIEDTDYISSSIYYVYNLNSSAVVSQDVYSTTEGFLISGDTNSSLLIDPGNFQMILTLVDSSSNNWVSSYRGSAKHRDTSLIAMWGGGSKSLTSELTQLGISYIGGSFRGGTANIQYQ